jgi:hypothetical protein
MWVELMKELSGGQASDLAHGPYYMSENSPQCKLTGLVYETVGLCVVRSILLLSDPQRRKIMVLMAVVNMKSNFWTNMAHSIVLSIK